MVASDHPIEALDAGRALGAVLGRAVGHAPLGGELALDLGAAHGGSALLRGGAALLDQPGAAAFGLGGGGALAVGLAVRAIGVLAGQVRGRDRLRRRFDRLQCFPLVLDRLFGLGNEGIAAIALCQDALLAAGRGLAKLAGGGEPGAAFRGDRDATESVRDLGEIVHDPRVFQQSARDRERGLRPVDEGGEGPGALARPGVGPVNRNSPGCGGPHDRVAAVSADTVLCGALVAWPQLASCYF